METDREIVLRPRIKVLTSLFIVGLILAGATAIPLKWELDVLASLTGADANSTGLLAEWIRHVHTALNQTAAQYPFLFYGTDWLAFGHFVIAIAFIGALRDPVRNCWLFTFGMISCALVVPYALIFGGLRGIPIWWRLVDCSFGVFGFVPVWVMQEMGGGTGGRRPDGETLATRRDEHKKEATRF